mgnify:CR=1 FL=1
MTAVNATDASDVLSQYQLKQQNGGQGTSELGRNEFMELMLAQLKNQNPLEPQDNGEFISQLAQFSSLEEMQNLSVTVEDVVGQFRSTQALQESAMGSWVPKVKLPGPLKCPLPRAACACPSRDRTVSGYVRSIWAVARQVLCPSAGMVRTATAIPCRLAPTELWQKLPIPMGRSSWAPW